METRIPPATSDPGLTPRPHGFLLVRLVGASALTLDHAIIGTGWVGLGALAIFMPVQTYLIDAFEVHAASASAANTVLRSFLGAFFTVGWARVVCGAGELGARVCCVGVYAAGLGDLAVWGEDGDSLSG